MQSLVNGLSANHFFSDKNFNQLEVQQAKTAETYVQKKIKKTTSTELLQFIPCYRNNHSFLININEIHYAHSRPATGVRLVTDEGIFHTSLPLKTLEEQSNLIRCHRQYLVRTSSIKIIEKLENGLGQGHIDNGDIIPVSRRSMGVFDRY